MITARQNFHQHSQRNNDSQPQGNDVVPVIARQSIYSSPDPATKGGSDEGGDELKTRWVVEYREKGSIFVQRSQ
jgi:hypothetical protein